jgi:hypothetical protein
VLSDDELIERLSMPALGMYSDFKQTGEIYPREKFSEIWPDVDYYSVIDELKNEGLHPEPAETFHIEPKGVIFTQRSARSIRID